MASNAQAILGTGRLAGSSGQNIGTPQEVRLVNRLNQSRSPYVRGHMHNPVAWQMWDKEALDLAKKENRLLFVSIGYAACHWCHVMERESFESQEIADILNKSFIPIKVDREERPDIDRIYMNYVQATTGSGGWPLNVFLTPDLEPVFGGTYWPGPNASTIMAGQIGFRDILEKIRDVWETQQERCLDSAKVITQQLKEFAAEGAQTRSTEDEDVDKLDLDLLEEAYNHFAAKYDKVNGGFSTAPKFPTPVNLAFLLRLGQFPSAVKDVVGEEECDTAAVMAINTLRHMTRGGIHDQIGHGFSRYSVTQDWSLPHFEKMLYDNAQLLHVYLDAFLVSKDPEMLGAVYDIATYLTTPPIAAPGGGFYSAEDADSLYRSTETEKREGAFYVWTRREFAAVLGERDADICARFWNVKSHGNVSPEHDAHDELMNQNVLSVTSTPTQLAKDFGLAEEEVVKIIREGRAKLNAHREKERPRPALDDKIVVGWNGLAIGALARASATLAEIDTSRSSICRKAAEQAAQFIYRELWDDKDAKLWRVYREGRGNAPGFADDYAFLISGLIDLYEATFNEEYLAFADKLQKAQITRFWDSKGFGFFSTEENQADLILRLKDGMDNAEPSTNGVSANNLFRLGSILEDTQYTGLAKKTSEAFGAEILQHPFLFTSMLSSVVSQCLTVRGIVFTGSDVDVEEALRTLRRRLFTNTTVSRVGGDMRSEWIRNRNPLLAAMDPMKEKVQVCEAGTCKEAFDLKELETVLDGL